jgi:hypothetical protein
MFGIPFHMFIRRMYCPDDVQGEETDPDPMKNHEMHVILDPGAIRIRELY